MAQPMFTPYPLVTSELSEANTPTMITNGIIPGGVIIQNPLVPEDQGLPEVEPLVIDIARLIDGQMRPRDSHIIQPGEIYVVPPNFEGTVWAKAATAGHKITGIALFPYTPFQAFDSVWPPKTFTTAMEVLRSYLYQQYNDDEDLIVFVMAYNAMTQQYITWFSSVMLPVYAENPMVNTKLLDWVAEGLYGMKRPTLSSGLTSNIGPFNTAMFNQLMFNEDFFDDPGPSFLTDDDTFKRILTWHLYKGDGKLFNTRWLKRRIERFLTGDQGGNGQSSAGTPGTADMRPPDQTYDVSVIFGPNNQVSINLKVARRVVTGGAMFNSGMFNEFEFNEMGTSATLSVVSPWAPVFKAAVEAGVLELPFQYAYQINVD
jgi:hypothetical protein